jgi:hypothetical protein
VAHVITGAARRGARAIRSAGPATVAVSIALLIGAASFANAANGGNFLLGKTNTENATAVLKDSTGIPLSLHAPAGQSPFSVNSTTQVNRLNAQYVGGEDAAQLQSTGGAGTTGPGAAIGLSDAYADVASTGPLPAGTYYVSATALIYTNETGPAYCVISSSPYAYGGGGGGAEASAQAAETAVATVAANTVLSERCAGYGNHQIVDNAEIIAIRIDSSSVGTKPLGKFKRFPPERTRGFASATHLGPAQ